MDSTNFDYAIHSDFLIYWTGKDIDQKYDQGWYDIDKSKTSKTCDVTNLYLERLNNILRFGLWMTSEDEQPIQLDGTRISIPTVPKTCFTELKLSQSRRHARRYGRLGIGVKRLFLFNRLGRPVVYYGLGQPARDDVFLAKCASELSDKTLLNFFKPMNSSSALTYDFYAESEWRILYFHELLSRRLIIDPRDHTNKKEHDYFNALTSGEQEKLKYLIPLDGWFSMIIYPSLGAKNKFRNKNRKASPSRRSRELKPFPTKEMGLRKAIGQLN